MAFSGPLWAGLQGEGSFSCMSGSLAWAGPIRAPFGAPAHGLRETGHFTPKLRALQVKVPVMKVEVLWPFMTIKVT